MFISETTGGGYDRHGEQRSGRGKFLILMEGESKDCQTMKAVVRTTSLRQFGHFMMGRAKIGGIKVSLSGGYGGDGLPITVPDQIYRANGLVVPQELYDAWNKGGGWNSCGSEAPDFRKWANENLKALTKNVKPKIEPTGLPNLDGMDKDEIMELYYERFSKSRRSHMLEWFGFRDDISEMDVSMIMAHSIGAKDARLKGHIEHALYVESLVDGYLKEIPEEFRW